MNPHPHIIFKFHIYIIYMTSKGIPKKKNKDVGKDPFNMNTNEKLANAIAFAQAIETAVSSNMTRETINALIVLKPSLKEYIDKLNALLSLIVTPAPTATTTTAITTTTSTASTTVPSPTPDTTAAPTTTTTRFQHPTIKELYVTPGGQLFCGEKKLNIRNNSGYAVVHFTTPEKGHVTANAARLAYEAANNVLLTQKYIMQFKDGDKMNIRPDNMYIVERTKILPQNKHITTTVPTTTTTTTASTTTTETETTSDVTTTTSTEIEGNVYNHPEIEDLVVNNIGDIFFNGKKLKKLLHAGKYIVWIKLNGKRLSKTAARLIYEAVNDVSLERKFIIGYHDGNPENLRPENLYTRNLGGRPRGSGVKTVVDVDFSASSEGDKWCTHPTYTDIEVNASTGEIRYKGEVAPILDKGGYPNINMGYTYKNASKIIYEAVHGCTLPDNMYVGPIDGDKYNLNPSNLRINPKLKGSVQERIEKVQEISELIRDHAEACDNVSSILRLITKKKPNVHTTCYFVDKMLKGGFSEITEKYFSVVNGKIVPVTNDRNDTNNMSRDLVVVARKQGIEKAHEILLDLIGKGSFEPNMADMAIAIIENMYDDCHKVRTAAEIQKTVQEYYGFNTPLFLIDSIRTKTKYRDIIESMVK